MAGVEVRIGANTDELDSAVKRSKARLNELSSGMRTGITAAAKFGAATAAAGAAVGVLAARSIEAARETANLARLANASVNTFQKMAFGANSVGISNQKLADILKDTTDRVGDFLSTGGGPMADFFENIAPKVGVTAEQFRKLSGPEALQLYVRSLEKANLSQSEMTFFMEAVASDATALLPLLRDNGAAMAEQARQAERLGIALSEIESNKIEDAAIQIDRVKSVFGGFSDQLAAEFSPLISASGRQLLGLAEDAGGVGEAAATSFNVVVDAVATVANALDRMDRALLQSETAVDQFALAFRVGLLEIAREIVEIPTAAVNEMLMAINNLPGVDVDLLGMSDLGKNIQSQVNSANAEIVRLQENLESELSKPLDGESFRRFVAEAQDAAKESAAAMAEIQAGISTGSASGGGTSGREELQKRLDEIREANMTEVQLEKEKFAQENEALNTALEQELITKQEWAELMAEQKAREEAKLTDIENKAAEARKQIAAKEAKFKEDALGNALSNLSTLMNTESRKMFEIGKAASLAQATIDGYAAITGAYKVGASIGGPILGAAYGAAAAAATFSQIQAIKSASFNGGGSAGSSGGSVTQGINNQTEEVRRTTSVDISLIGADSRDRAVAGSIISQINDEIEAGGRISRVGLQ